MRGDGVPQGFGPRDQRLQGGDLPLLGYLFKTTSKSLEKTELLIFLTPRVVKESVTAVR